LLIAGISNERQVYGGDGLFLHVIRESIDVVVKVILIKDYKSKKIKKNNDDHL